MCVNVQVRGCRSRAGGIRMLWTLCVSNRILLPLVSLSSKMDPLSGMSDSKFGPWL